jgi:hypothetical protein
MRTTMGREIRVTVDDDEVFERMKARKRELDLSWREVLHRGLWSEAGDDGGWAGPGETDRSSSDYRGSPGDDFGDRLERQIRRRVERSLRSAFGDDDAGPGHGPGPVEVEIDHPSPPDPPSPPGAPDVEDLEAAEDAVLRFPFLDGSEDPEYGVPLRVNLETTADGLDVEVVAVRTGKSVRGMNAFDREARMGIARGFSRGERARLELGDGEEHYGVAVSLSWGRAEDGRPTVDGVEVAEVVFGGD